MKVNVIKSEAQRVQIEVVAERAEPAPLRQERLPLPPALLKGKRVETLRYPKATTRVGTKAATVYLSPEAHRQLKKLGLDEEKEVQDLMREGLNLLFEKRGLGRIA